MDAPRDVSMHIGIGPTKSIGDDMYGIIPFKIEGEYFFLKLGYRLVDP